MAVVLTIADDMMTSASALSAGVVGACASRRESNMGTIAPPSYGPCRLCDGLMDTDAGRQEMVDRSSHTTYSDRLSRWHYAVTAVSLLTVA